MAPILLSILLSLAAGPHGQAEPPVFLVVVNEANAVETMSVEQLSKIFLRKLARWQNGSRITVVDQHPATPVRERFSADVHRRPVAAVVAYWQQQIFSGRELPPSERKDDAAVLEHVRQNPEAVGYVSAQTPLGPGVKVLRVTS